jgi:hypothetical protein
MPFIAFQMAKSSLLMLPANVLSGVAQGVGLRHDPPAAVDFGQEHAGVRLDRGDLLVAVVGRIA